MATKRIILIQIEGSKKLYQVRLDAMLQILREREFNVMQSHHFSENMKLVNAMEKDAETTLYNSHDKYDVEYDI